jgi:hypothetical protein
LSAVIPSAVVREYGPNSCGDASSSCSWSSSNNTDELWEWFKGTPYALAAALVVVEVRLEEEAEALRARDNMMGGYLAPVWCVGAVDA